MNVVTPPAYMYAPYTPFTNDDPIRPSLNLDQIPNIVSAAIDNGINVFWIGGSNAQFTAMSVDERKSLCSAYVAAINATGISGIYSIFHIGATRIDEAVELAAYAPECGVNAIGSLPPYYNRVSSSNLAALWTWFEPLVTASGNMPFWFYHYPGRTNYNVAVYNLLTSAITDGNLPQFEGIKFNYNDAMDFYQTTEAFGDSIAIIPYYYPELGITGMSKGFGTGTSDYMVPVSHCIKQTVSEGRSDDAYWYQTFSMTPWSISGGAVGDRCVYQRYNIDFGPPRPPLIPLTQQQCDDINSQLDDINFFDTLQAIKNDTYCNRTSRYRQ